MKKLFILFILLCVNFLLVYSQKMRTGLEYKYDVAKLINANKAVYYGWDYRFLIFSDPNLKDAEELKTKIIPGLIGLLDNRNLGDRYMQKVLKKENYTYDPREIQFLMKNIDSKHLVDVYRYPLQIDSITNIVKSYVLKATEGIGVVVIADEMRKHDITVTAFVTIFDIKSRELLYVCKIKGKAGDKFGLINFYGKGITEIMDIYRGYYRKLYKE